MRKAVLLLNKAVFCNYFKREQMCKRVTMAEKEDKNVKKNVSFKTTLQILIKANIFKFKKKDAVGYFILYIIIPITITVISLIQNQKNEITNIIYCYMTILISSINAIYDGTNRWTNNKSPVNLKIFIIYMSNAVVCMYCIAMILGRLIQGEEWSWQLDQVLLSYLVSVIIALIDIITCFTKDIALNGYIKGGK